jgi:chromosome segregation ATPase
MSGIAQCINCNEVKKISAKQLCWSCYRKSKNGTGEMRVEITHKVQTRKRRTSVNFNEEESSSDDESFDNGSLANSSSNSLRKKYKQLEKRFDEVKSTNTRWYTELESTYQELSERDRRVQLLEEQKEALELQLRVRDKEIQQLRGALLRKFETFSDRGDRITEDDLKKIQFGSRSAFMDLDSLQLPVDPLFSQHSE